MVSDLDPKNLHSIQHIELASTQPEKLRDFLAAEFGWKFESHPMPGGGTYHMFRAPDGNGGGILAPQPGQPVAATPYINVADADKTLKRCEKAGAKILVPVTEVPGMGRFFWFQAAGGPPLACWQPTGQ